MFRHCIYVCTRSNQTLDNLNVPAMGSSMESGIPIYIYFIYTRAVSKQLSNRLSISPCGCSHQWCGAGSSGFSWCGWVVAASGQHQAANHAQNQDLGPHKESEAYATIFGKLLRHAF